MINLSAMVKRFYLYQKKRFPVIVLGVSFLPAILSSGAIMVTQTDLKFVIAALLVSLAYLLHVRIIDEFRDYEHDLTHHKDRPLQSGVITLMELGVVDKIATATVVIVALYGGMWAQFIALAMFLYSYLAGKEFFLGSKLKNHFYIYNAVNLVQMLLLQVFIYSIANNSFSFNPLVPVHFLFIASGTVIFEFLRKVKGPEQDGTGQDTYTWFLGINNAILVYATLAVLNIMFFAKIMLLSKITLKYWVPLALALIIFTLITIFIHKIRKEEKTNQLMQLSFMVMYGGFNILMFINL